MKKYAIITAVALLLLLAGHAQAESINMSMDFAPPVQTFEKMRLSPHAVSSGDCTADNIGMIAYDNTDSNNQIIRVCKSPDNVTYVWEELKGLWEHNENPTNIHNVYLLNNDEWVDNQVNERIRIGFGTVSPKQTLHIVDEDRSQEDFMNSGMRGIIVESEESAFQIISKKGSKNSSGIVLSGADDLGGNTHWYMGRIGSYVPPNCGDGNTDVGEFETCDDGCGPDTPGVCDENDNGDGCNQYCQDEVTYPHPLPPSRFAIAHMTSTGDFLPNASSSANVTANEYLSMLPSGEVAIGGTPTTDVKLTVDTSTETGESTQILIDGRSPRVTWYDNDTNADCYRIDADNDYLNFAYEEVYDSGPDAGKKAGWERYMTLSQEAHLGIGDHLPTAPLHISRLGDNDNLIIIEGEDPAIEWNDSDDHSFVIKSENSNLNFYAEDSLGNLNNPKMSLTKLGYLGIGTTNPNTRFHMRTYNVSGPGTDPDSVYLESDAEASMFFRPAIGNGFNLSSQNGAFNFGLADDPNGTSFTNAITFLENGKVGLSQTNPQTALHLKTIPGQNETGIGFLGNGHHLIFADTTPGTPGEADFKIGCCSETGTNTGALRFFVDEGSDGVFESEIMAIRENGNVGIGVASPQYAMHVNGDVSATNCYKVDGNPLGGSCTSDKRLKENIEPLDNSLDQLSQLNPVSYNFKDSKYGAGTQTGLIAQEVQEIFPEWVNERDDGNLSINYGLQIQMHLIDALNELTEKNESLYRELEELEKQL